MGRARRETIRRLRLGDLRRLLQHRYGHTLPDDDAGRADLELLLRLGMDKFMSNIIEVSAPWMETSEAEAVMDHIKRLPHKVRWLSPAKLGECLRLTNDEREGLKLWRIRPYDMTDEQLAEQRKAKDRARKRKRSKRTRPDYEANSLNKQKPWEAEGISRRTWERRRVASLSETKTNMERTYLGQPPKGLQQTASTPPLRLTTNAGRNGEKCGCSLQNGQTCDSEKLGCEEEGLRAAEALWRIHESWIFRHICLRAELKG